MNGKSKGNIWFFCFFNSTEDRGATLRIPPSPGPMIGGIKKISKLKMCVLVALGVILFF